MLGVINTQGNKEYHYEIDGLRAIAVVVIILFHLKVAGFAGGFIGVDVFFVVSGYLITQIIVFNLAEGSFSFKDFYIRRSTRILPALLATILVILPLAMYLQQPASLVHTAKESIYAVFSLSNFYFWSETSYWAPSSEKYVLLHTWSLGVEEQFYLVYSLLIFAGHRMAGMKGVIVLLLVTAVLGAIGREIILKTDRSAAFFFTPLRFYEFALGGLAATLTGLKALQKSPWASGGATLLGLVLILYGCVYFNQFTALPGITILVPLTGALLILLAGPSHSARILLMNPVMSWLGKTSYSLYLVHWPIIVFYRGYHGSHLTLLEQAGLFLLILVVAMLLNRCVERRFRLSHDGKTTVNGVSSRSVLLGTLVAVVLISTTSALLVATRGWPSRLPDGAQALMDINPRADTQLRIKRLKEQCTPHGEIFCGKHRPGETNILLLADSRGPDMYIALKVAFPDANIQTSFAMGCAPVFSPSGSWSPFFAGCPELNEARLKIALDAPAEDIIFLAQNLIDGRSVAALETVKRLREAGKTVYLLGQFVFVENKSPVEISIDMLRFDLEGTELSKYLVAEPFKLDQEYADQVRKMGAVYISNKSFFYDGSYHYTDRETGKLLTFDGNHLNILGAEKFGIYLRENYPLP